MFGYIKISKGELKVKEYEMYKAVYCSLCKTLGKHYGILSRLTLSYDFTFLALLNMSLKEGCDQIERKRCTFNPLKKCNYCKNTDSLSMPSAVAMIMLYFKILDNIADEKGFKKMGFTLLKPIFKGAYKKASKNFPHINDIVKEYIDTQNSLEKSGCEQLDEVADPTAKALSKIFMLCSEDETQKLVLQRLGYCLGRYVYLLDAAADFSKDTEQNKYNVLKFTCKTQEDVNKKIEPQLYFCINEGAKAFELLDIKKYKHILGNIIYLGLEDTFKKELEI
ncbi:MAG: hypothetical protein J6B22_01290 [Clostridia bacterium]|nr:hypothetical protein [Clostridia bacterium]